MRKQAVRILSGFLLFLLFILPATLLAAPYYQGKIITIVVGSTPGGGYDRMSRIFARGISKHIPGNPKIIINNMPGASSMIAVNYLYNIAKPDGLTIGLFNQGIPIAQLMKSDGVRFNLEKFAWIGSTAVAPTVLLIRSDLPYGTFDDLKRTKSTFHLTSAGPGTQTGQFLSLLKAFVVGFNFDISVYPGTADQMLAIERKEADGTASSLDSMRPYIERGLLRTVMRGRVSSPLVEKLPVDEDLTTDKRGKVLMVIRSATDQIARPFVAPPGTPTDVMNILREAFAKAANDPEILADAVKFQMTIKYVSQNECLKILNYIFNQPPDIIKELSKYIKFG